MNDIREDLKAFVDGELSPERMAEVQAAIEADPALKQEAEYMRMLGFEIKKLAADPAVAGKEATVDKFRKPLAPWWDTSRLAGRLAYAGALFLVLAGVSTILFPVFAQPKEASKKTAALSAAKQEAIRLELQREDAESGGATSAFGDAPAEAPAPGRGMAGAAGGEQRFNRAQAPEFKPSDQVVAGRSGFGAEFPTPEAEAPSMPSIAGKPKGSDKGRTTASNTNVRKGNLEIKPTGSKSSSTGTTKLPEAPPTNRMVIKNSDISLKVDDAKKSLTDAEQLAKSLGGYVEGGNLTSPPNDVPSASAVLRVPSRMYEGAMKALRGMGEVLSESSNAQDVTAQHADVTGRLTVLRAEADSYVTMLRGAKKIGELMEIKDRLSQVRQEIASLQSQAKALQNESALSTIRATFTQKETIEKEKQQEKSGFEETWAKAVNGLSAVGSFLGNLVIYLFVFSPVWLPPVLLFWWLSKKAKAA